MNSFKRVRAFQIELKMGMLVFKERGKPEYPEKNSWSKGENQQQTQPTYGVDARSSNPGHIGGRRVLSPLRHPYFPGSILFYFRLPKIVNRIEKTGTYKSLLKDHCHGIRHFFNEQV